jgi:putative tryptophan/tyrosine transport system substrate-binding protein
MRRREFISLIGGAAVTWPLAARAQQPAMPVIGFLGSNSTGMWAGHLRAFRQGLSEIGYVEGRNVAIEYRWAQNEPNLLAEMAADLVRHRVSVIAAGSTSAALAAKVATATIPIVFESGGDPVQAGLVASLDRPGDNVTGVSSMNAELPSKQLGLLHELLPQAMRFAVLVNPNYSYSESVVTGLRVAAGAIGRQIEVLSVSTNRDINTVFASLAQKQSDALLVSTDTLFIDRYVQLVTLATRHAVPAIYPWREIVEIGGLMSYGSNVADLFRRTGIYIGRILKGEKPADLPILRATKFELVINLQTAKTLGIDVPPTLLARADEVIE